jgi:uncharacterized membrane protein YhaH (DUF805 family)
MNWANLFFSPEGRIGRGEFWIAFLILTAAHMVVHFIPLIGTAFWVYLGVCVYSKRLHDMGKSGWWQILPAVATVILVSAGVVMGGFGIFMAVAAGNTNAATGALMAFGGLLVLALIWLAVHLIFTLWVGLTAGEPGDNRYGPAPAPVSAGVGV